MTKTQAKKIIDTAWRQLLTLAASKMAMGAERELLGALKAERAEARNPSFTRHSDEWCKAGIINSVVIGSSTSRTIGSLYAIRDAHAKAMIIGAAFSDVVMSAEFDTAALAEAKDLF